MNRLLLLAILLILTLLVAACSPSAPAADTNNSTENGASTNFDASTPVVAPTSDAVIQVVPSPTPEPVEEETRSIEDIDNSLALLDSYRLRFTFAYDGVDAQGQPQQGSVDMTQEVITASQDQALRMTVIGMGTGPDSEGSTFGFYRIGDASYTLISGGAEGQQCLATPEGMDSPDGLLVAPDDIIGGIEGATLVGRGQMVNGVLADHYTIDQSGLSFGSFSSAKGDVWIAQEGGYLVKYVGEATGESTFLGDAETEGLFVWEYNLEQINQLSEIAIPAECQ